MVLARDNQQVVTITDERVLDSFRPEVPDIGALWELCLHREWDRPKAVAGIASWLGPPDGLAILDAACGSGFPAIDLAQRGYDLTCADGSARMLDYFRRNARQAGVDLQPWHLRWDQLPGRFAGQFDVVICRGGGSLIYAGTWDEDMPPDRHAIGETLQHFVTCLRPGGRLYVDITRSEDLARTEPHVYRHPRYEIGGRSVELAEFITVDLVNRTRRWQSRLAIDGVTYVFTRRSHYLTHEELVRLLHKAGLTDVHEEHVPGESYAVFVGRQPEV
jgi:SAM-dependent methyltransferase